MAGSHQAVTARVQGAAARTSATGSARLSYGLPRGAPTLEERDQLGDGVVDFTNRRAQVSRLFVPGRVREGLQSVPEAFARPRKMLYDGAIELMRSGDSWVSFTDGDRDDPRSHQDPLWPLDALFGASDDVVEVDTDAIRDVTTTHYRLTVDLAAADELLPMGIEMPAAPFRRLRELAAEVWLDDAGLARRIAIQNAGGNRQVWKVVELWDFGVAVAIPTPDADQIMTPDPTDLQRILMEDS